MMENARKMVIVPQELIDKFQSFDSSQKSAKRAYKSLDDEMEEIMKNKRFDDSEKWKLYNQVLQRFLNLASNKRKPINIPIVNTTFTDQTQRQPLQEEWNEEPQTHYIPPNQIEEITGSFSKAYQNDARSLLRFMIRNGSPISWDNNLELYIDGKKIPGSNIVDLTHYVVRARSAQSLPEGARTLLNVLKQMNVPKEYFHNRRALQHLTDDPDAEIPPSPLADNEVPLRRTPMRDRLRSRERRNIVNQSFLESLDNWEPYEP